MALNLGNYSDQLSIDDYDKALANSGYAPQQQSSQFDPGSSANPYGGAGAAPVAQASDAERPPDYANGQYSGGDVYKDAMAIGAGKSENGKKKGENALGLVGKILAFL